MEVAICGLQFFIKAFNIEISAEGDSLRTINETLEFRTDLQNKIPREKSVEDANCDLQFSSCLYLSNQNNHYGQERITILIGRKEDIEQNIHGAKREDNA
jgi:hypothetical protein